MPSTNPPAPSSPSAYRPAPIIETVADWLGDPVEAADFPQTVLRFRNDRAAKQVGLDSLSDEEWIAHFGRFTPLADNLPRPLAMRYHGHQFRVYNPDIGDGRGFLFAQLRDGDDRILDLGTKGSGQTPYSRRGDGRLTLKGAVREILATEMLEAQGVVTSRTFSVIETGEPLQRGDEPSPTRSAVMVRLQHSHIRIGSFQRLAVLEEHEHLAALVDYCLQHYPGPPPPQEASDQQSSAARLLHQVVERLADLAAGYMVAGFVHGVLNTDNMNISGESFDYGPWRWLPRWNPGFTAAYFDHSGLYAFGRQAEAIHWNCVQLAIALRPLCEAAPLMEALDRFGGLYEAALGRKWCERLGLEPLDPETNRDLVAQSEAAMQASGEVPEAFFFRHRGGRGGDNVLREAFVRYTPIGDDHEYWAGAGPETMVIEEVEAIWSAIDQHDDWKPLNTKVAVVRRMGEAHGRRA